MVMTFTTKRLMVVEDDPEVRQLILYTFEDEGYEVSTASNGMEALEKIAVCSPDVILLDINMPVMDGATLANELKRHPTTRDVPLVALSAAANLRSHVGMPVESWIVKPFDMEQLFTVIDILAERQRRQRELLNAD
jgi:CheY-like chemotaxis protein